MVMFYCYVPAGDTRSESGVKWPEHQWHRTADHHGGSPHSEGGRDTTRTGGTSGTGRHTATATNVANTTSKCLYTNELSGLCLKWFVRCTRPGQEDNRQS